MLLYCNNYLAILIISWPVVVYIKYTLLIDPCCMLTPQASILLPYPAGTETFYLAFRGQILLE